MGFRNLKGLGPASEGRTLLLGPKVSDCFIYSVTTFTISVA